MRNGRLFQTGIVLGSLVLMTGACKREATAPELQTTRGEQARMQPISVTGCLRGGLAENTYVLIASQTSGGATDTATQARGACRREASAPSSCARRVSPRTLYNPVSRSSRLSSRH